MSYKEWLSSYACNIVPGHWYRKWHRDHFKDKYRNGISIQKFVKVINYDIKINFVCLLL